MDFLEDEIKEILNIFREESEEQIQRLNQNLLKLENNPTDHGIISELFRDAHSIKGSARMIGLNDIQAVAHKVEDILGLAKENKLRATPKIIDVLCKAVDCIASIVEESIQTRGESHSVGVDEVISIIDKIRIESESFSETNPDPDNITTHETEQARFKREEIEIIFCKESISLLPRAKSLIKRLENSTDDEPALADLYKLFTILDNSAQLTNLNDIRFSIENIHIKVEGIVKGSGILIDSEVDEIKTNFEEFCKELANLATKFNIIIHEAQKEHATLPIKINNEERLITEKIPKPEEIIKNTVCKQHGLKPAFDFISDNLIFVGDSTPNAITTCGILLDKLQEIITAPIPADIIRIFEKIMEIVAFSNENNLKPGSEILDVIKQSFDAGISFLNSPEDITDDPNLIVQRLSIILQMLKLAEHEPMEQSTPELKEIPEFIPALKNSNVFISEEQPQKSSFNNSKTETTTIKTLRVDTKKLDQLVTLVGELIIAKIKAKEHLLDIDKVVRLSEDWYRELNKAKKLLKHIDKIEKKPLKPSELPSGTSVYTQYKSIFTVFDNNFIRLSDFMKRMNTLYKTVQEDDARLNLIVNELEEKIKSIRVLPLATIFHMFPRMVRDISRDQNKEIELIITGSETSVDKKIIEEINSPLTHILRNSIDHGIELPDIREKNGKNRIGQIHLTASHLENSVLIEVIDDGKGIDLEAIKRKVLKKGLLTLTELQAMTDEQITNIIFWPGFSTGEVVTDISGRGVGLDIVYNKIAQLNGRVNIKSNPGKGCKVSIQLPVTMATIKSFLVKANNQTFAIPTSAIKTTLLLKPEDIFFKEGAETIKFNNKTVPICKLSTVLEMPETKLLSENKLTVIIVQAEDTQVGFIIDKLLGNQDILHKNLTMPLLRVRNVAGVTILGSGELCLILNVSDLIKSAHSGFGIGSSRGSSDKETAVSNHKRNILVVDDSVTTRILERNILRAAGYNVTIAVNGLDALTKILSENFDLIVSDIEMPEINGFELTERLRKDEKHKEIPIILVTSLASEIDKKKGLSLGANAYISKGNFDQEELLLTIKKLLIHSQ